MRFFNLFGIADAMRRRKRIDRRDNSEDWRTGDLALCVFDRWLVPHDGNPRRGDVLRVNHIAQGTAENASHILVIGLGFESKPPGILWATSAFRKIRPEHKKADEECEPLMRVLRGPKVPA